jgi:hypothetical protein
MKWGGGGYFLHKKEKEKKETREGDMRGCLTGYN